MQAEAETEEAVEEKRYNFTTLLFSPPFLRVSLFAARAEVVRTLAGASERAAAPPVRPPRAAFTSLVLSTRRGRFTSFFFFFNVPTVENKQNLEERFLFGGAVGSK